MLIMSKIVMLAGGMWKFEIFRFMAAPCSTNREIICINTTDDNMVHSHIGRSLSTHFTSSTWVTVHSRHGCGFWASSGVMIDARSRNLKSLV